jgi:putative aminopeptidase FrvX
MSYEYLHSDSCLIGKITNSVFKNAPITITFKTNNKLSKVVKPRNNPPHNMNEKQGVYKINCGEWDVYYIDWAQL